MGSNASKLVYPSGVAAGADHHAGDVSEVAMALAGFIVLYKDENTGIRVMAGLFCFKPWAAARH